MSEKDDNKCDGCIYRINGERKDRTGFIVKASACLCEEEMSAGCIPTYKFSEHYLYKGTWVLDDNFHLVFTHKNQFLPEVTQTNCVEKSEAPK